MKFVIILVMLTACTASVNAQTNDIFKRRPWNEAKLKWLLQDTLSKLRSIPNSLNTVPNSLNAAPNTTYMIPQQTKDGVYKIPSKGVYTGDNGRGDEIYAMQIDNMPCLVPGKSFVSEMPVVGMEKSDKSLLPLLQKGEKKGGEID